ncbi:MAG: hypothetical protein IPH76_19100 [Xanthomonadales bacterium]|nr:hypothetical protein [Xanthomonadales bacterium]
MIASVLTAHAASRGVRALRNRAIRHATAVSAGSSDSLGGSWIMDANHSGRHHAESSVGTCAVATCGVLRLTEVKAG